MDKVSSEAAASASIKKRVQKKQTPYSPTFSPKFDLKEWSGQRKHLLVAALPRAGSHFLGHTMYATGKLGFPLEYLKPAHWAAWERRCGSTQPREVLQFLEQHRTSPTGIFSVKLHWEDMKTLRERGLLGIFDNSFVVMIQRNSIVKQAISWSIARQTSSWISKQKPLSAPIYSFSEIHSLIERILEYEAKWRRFLANANIVPITVFYEDFCLDRRYWIGRIAEHVGLKFDLAEKLPETNLQIQRTSISEQWETQYLRSVGAAID